MRRTAMVVLLAVLLVVSLSTLIAPALLRARSTPALNLCVNNLRVLAGAQDQLALEFHRASNDVPTADDLRPYLKQERLPVCPAGGTYELRGSGAAPRCSIGGPQHSLNRDDSGERRLDAVAGALAVLSGVGLILLRRGGRAEARFRHPTELAAAPPQCHVSTVRAFGTVTFPYSSDTIGSAAQFNRGVSAMPSDALRNHTACAFGHGGYTASG